MNEPLSIDAARKNFSDEMRKSNFVPDTAEISILPTGGGITIIHCCWPLVQAGIKSYSREILVHISAKAMSRYCAVNEDERAAILSKFGSVFGKRMEKYNPKIPSPPAFNLHFDEPDL